jgi:Ca-activated chloride channel family protein
MALSIAVAAAEVGAATPGEQPAACNDDAMIVFDASGSMAGTDRLGITTMVTRIEKVRTALGQVLPEVAPSRRIGLITYGPGPYNKCDNIHLDVEPAFNAAGPIMDAVKKLNPAGRTPLTASVSEAAHVLRFKEKPAVIVVVTDGEETCGGAPCTLAEDLRREGKQTTVHVIGYRVKDYSWTGDQAYQSKCLPEKTGGLYISVQTSDELVAAFRKTLGCPYLTERDARDRPTAIN